MVENSSKESNLLIFSFQLGVAFANLLPVNKLQGINSHNILPCQNAALEIVRVSCLECCSWDLKDF